MSPQEQEEMRQATLSIFVPASQAAICADAECGGIFLSVNGKCPGCGSRSWILFEPSLWVKANMQRAGEERGA